MKAIEKGIRVLEGSAKQEPRRQNALQISQKQDRHYTKKRRISMQDAVKKEHQNTDQTKKEKSSQSTIKAKRTRIKTRIKKTNREEDQGSDGNRRKKKEEIRSRIKFNFTAREK